MPAVSAFKLLYSTMFKEGKIPDKLKKPIKCFVKEAGPYFLVTDDFFYVPAYFTKKAADSCSKGFGNLQGKVITITDWSLELAKVKSSGVFTSYAGIELRFVVNAFKSADSSSDSIALNRTPSNIYRDSEIKAMINKYVYDAQSKAIASSANASLPDIAKMSGKGKVSDGIVKCADAKYGFKAATATVAMNLSGKAKAAAKAMKPKVTGGAIKKAAKAGKKGGSVAAKLMKASTSKKSVARAGTPGGDASGAATTDVKTMRMFQKLKKLHQKRK